MTLLLLLSLLFAIGVMGALRLRTDLRSRQPEAERTHDAEEQCRAAAQPLVSYFVLMNIDGTERDR